MLWAISAALGPLAAAVFHEPQLVVIMPAIGSTFFIQGLGSTHYALAMKSIDFRSRTIAELTEAVVRGIVGVALALIGVGVWALIGGYIAGSVAMSWAVWHLVEYAPRLRASRRHLRRLLTFGGALTGVGIMAAFLNQFDNVVVGECSARTQLGFYSIATRLPYLFIITLAAATGQVLFPAFAALEGDAMVPFSHLVALHGLRGAAAHRDPDHAGRAADARGLRPAVEPGGGGDPGAVPVGAHVPHQHGVRQRLQGAGPARTAAVLAFPQAIALIVGSLVFVHQGIVAVSWVQAVIAIVAQAVTLVLACRMFSVTPRMLWSAMGPPLVAAAALAVVLYLINRAFTTPGVTIIVGGAAGAVVYFGLLHLLAADLLRRLRAMAFPRSAYRRRRPLFVGIGPHSFL